METLQNYWPWWLSGIALGSLTIAFRLLTGRALGVSGSWQRVVLWRQERQRDQKAAALNTSQGGATNALLAATLAEFGDDAFADNGGQSGADDGGSANTQAAKANVPWTAHLVFLVSMVLGGLLWAVYTGNFHLQFELSPLHTRLSGTGWQVGFVLFSGGFLVGIGTQMAGGCSSGHGLSGCANFAPASLAATVAFFASAVLVSLSLGVFL
jgi:uncharacterized membrane protein YedE/YeeE